MSDRDEPGEPDDATLWSGRLRPWPTAPEAEEPEPEADDATRLVRRRGTDPDDSLDGATRLVRRREPASPASEPAGPASAPTGPAPEPPTEHTQLRRATRREDSPQIAAPADTARSANVPTGHAREIYKPRAVDPVIAERRPPAVPAAAVPAEEQAFPDPTSAARRTRARRIRMVLVGAVVLIAVIAAVTAVILLAALPVEG